MLPPTAVTLSMSQLSAMLPAAAIADAGVGNVAGLQPKFTGVKGISGNVGLSVSTFHL